MSAQPAVVIEGVAKNFGEVEALKGIDLEIAAGQVFGLLGPNGAGKTTLVRILSTLLRPDRGRATVLGLDAVTDAVALRSQIGLAGQSAAVDQALTGFENVQMIARLYNIPAAEARARANDLLERLGLTESAGRQVRAYSGGMRKRLDLAASLVGRPRMMIMDEPTTGLDPRSRIELWEIIEELVDEGTTLLLTTQYLDEADRLATRLAVIDRGELISVGTPNELKDQLGGDVLEVQPQDHGQSQSAAELIAGFAKGEVAIDEFSGRLSLTVGNDSAAVMGALRTLQDGGIAVADLQLRRPTLDDVFLTITGHSAEEVAIGGESTNRRRRRQGR